MCVILNIPYSFALEFTEMLEVRQLVCLDIMLTTILHAYFILLGVDFVGGKYKIYVLPGSTDRCMNITILNDNIALEENENFAVEIVMASAPIYFLPHTGQRKQSCAKHNINC